MIVEKTIEMIVNKSNKSYYSNIIGEQVILGEIVKIDITHLSKGSHYKILVKCDICENESRKPYRQYLQSMKNGNIYCCSPTCAQIKNKKTNIEKYGVENVFQSNEIKDRIVKTNNEKYGVDYPQQSSEIVKKTKLTNIEKYGIDWASKSEAVKKKMRNTCISRYGSANYTSSEYAKVKRIKNKRQIPDELKTDFEIYTREVRNISNKLRDSLFEAWDGLDFYDNELIINNLNLPVSDKRYPTVDHKISIQHGFINNIPVDIIGGLDNLCITKRSINSRKHTSCVVL